MVSPVKDNDIILAGTLEVMLRWNGACLTPASAEEKRTPCCVESHFFSDGSTPHQAQHLRKSIEIFQQTTEFIFHAFIISLLFNRGNKS